VLFQLLTGQGPPLAGSVVAVRSCVCRWGLASGDNCRSVVGRLCDPVLFELAVTLEVDALATVPAYAEVADRIRLQARAWARARA
jgi:hypothetical protein